MQQIAHDFDKSLRMSHRASDLPFWRETYKLAFHDMVAMVDHRQDGWHQRAGVDRSIIMASSKHVLIDEKVRGRNEKTGMVYEDIALEYWSDYGKRVPGWVCKPLMADYIAYAIAPIGKCYLLPVTQLQGAWRKNCDAWLKQYETIRAFNKKHGREWVTWSCCVDPKILFPEIGRCLRIDFEPFEVCDAYVGRK